MTGYIAPSAVIDPNVQIEGNVWIWHFSHVRSGSKLTENVSIGEHCYVGPNTLVGRGSKIQNGVQLHDTTIIEEGVFIGPNSIITNDRKPRAMSKSGDRFGNGEWKKEETRICRGASIGANSVIVAPALIGEWAMIGAGSVVTRDIPSHALFAGNPARFRYWIGFKGERLIAESSNWLSPLTGELFSSDNLTKGLRYVE
jgi:UDP-2-acetamido-3-amino-2,3-dideoxy-glucuronate N-acetyltransferase